MAILFASVIALVNLTVASQAKADDQVQLKRVANEYLIVGRAQYKKEMYSAAIESLTKADQKRQYLDASQQDELDSLIAKVNDKLADARKVKLIEAYNKSVQLYSEGNIQEARAGFSEIAASGMQLDVAGMTAQEYIDKIDAELQAQQQEKAAEETAEISDYEMPVEDVLPAVEPAQEPQDQLSGSYVAQINQQRLIQQRYTKAVVDDAISSAQQSLAEQDFEKAKAKLVQAQALVEKNSMALGDELYKEYSSKLDIVNQQIQQQQSDYEKTIQAEKLTQGKLVAEQYRQQQEIERQKRIGELLENARVFQKQQRYEDALKQIELLLAIDPLNDIALTTKMLLEDTINFRKELMLRKEIDKQEVGTFRNITESTIPYDSDITFPKTWREISARRDGGKTDGMSEEDAAVYRQLSQTVDLSALTPDTPLNEAVDILRNSTTPALKIIVLWRDLSENAYIDPTTPINMEGVPAITVSKGLDLILNSVSAGIAQLRYGVEDGIITVATAGQVKIKMTTEVYDITELLQQPSAVSFNLDDISDIGGGGDARGGGGTRTRTTTTNQQQDLTGEQARTRASESANEIIQTIQNSIDPDSWYEMGGDATVQVHSGSKLIIRQTPENHQKIAALIKALRGSLSQQVALEARFLLVSEEFLENINFDVDFFYDGGKDWGIIGFEQNNLDGSQLVGTPAMQFSGSYQNIILDSLQVNFLIAATQRYTNSKSLNAPKVTVLSGERAAIRITNDQAYVSDYDFENITQSGDNQNTTIVADPQISIVTDGVILNVLPVVSADKKYVLLEISTSQSNVNIVQFDVPSETGNDYPIGLPVLNSNTINTRVTVPDQGTLLIGGLKVNDELENEKGVPVLSKVPVLGRLFRNKNEQKSQQVLLILVKPTIIINEEAEEDAIRALRG